MATKARWSTEESRDLYRIDHWSQGYFTVNELGNVCVKPSPDSPYKVDLKKLVDELRERKIDPPILIRFTDILKDRLEKLSKCFSKAIEDNQYKGIYKPLFPIKVNQEKDVVTSVLKYGKDWGVGLEAGSKAELLIVLAQTQEVDTPIVCNGYKDEEFVRMVGMAHKMGKKIFPVIENFSELYTFIAHYKATGIMPRLGLRIKLTTKGTGQWAKSGGDASKFGLRIPEVMSAIRLLESEGLLANLKLLHFHVGSQISRIGVVKQAILETTRVYVEMVKLGACLEYIDIGGGLGVDYTGGSSSGAINYTSYEYANDIIYRIKQLCDEYQIPHPDIFSESGRFLSAHYSMMVTNVSATGSLPDLQPPLENPTRGYGPLHEINEILNTLNENNILECYHDALQYKHEAQNLFNLGHLTLPERAWMEGQFWEIMRRVLALSKKVGLKADDLEALDSQLADTYFTNFSVFQSLPDAWAINQVFPIMPIHRLTEQPNKYALIADLTCDSDGLLDRYVAADGNESSLPLHEVSAEEPYYLGVFLIGAYQETLGELHNLFGDPHAVLIEIGGENQYRMAGLVTGDTIEAVISYMSYDTSKLVAKMRMQIEEAVEAGRLTISESAQMMESYVEGLRGYTYFND
jgi:arginine decarboxylase